MALAHLYWRFIAIRWRREKLNWWFMPNIVMKTKEFKDWLHNLKLIFSIPSYYLSLSSPFFWYNLKEFLRSSRARRRYWARSYAGWRQFTAAQPSAAHCALAAFENAGRVDFMVTQNVDRYLVIYHYQLSLLRILEILRFHASLSYSFVISCFQAASPSW